MTALTDQEPQPTQRQQPRRRRSSCSHESILSDLFSEAASISSGRFLSSGCAEDSVVGSLVDVNIHDDGERFDEEVAHGQQDVIIEVASKKSDHHGMFDVHSVNEPIESQQSQSATAIRTDRPISSQPSSQGSSTLFGLDTPMDKNISLLADTDANVNALDDTPSTSVTTATAPDATTNTFAPSTSTSLSPLPPFPEQYFVDQEIIFPLDRLPSATSASFTYPSLPQVSGITSHTCTYATFKEHRRRSEQNESHLAIARGFIHSLDNDDSDDEGSACDHQDDTSTIGDSCVPGRYISEEEETFEDRRRRKDLNEHHVACADEFLVDDDDNQEDDSDFSDDDDYVQCHFACYE